MKIRFISRALTTAVLVVFALVPWSAPAHADHVRCEEAQDSDDLYRCYGDLAAHETKGVDYRVMVRDRDTSLAVIAVHGGGIEPRTGQLASAIAGTTLSWYRFEGIKDSDNYDLHITSTNFDEPRALALVRDSDRVLSVHGMRGSDCTTLVGGRDELRREAVARALNAAGFHATTGTSGGLSGTSTRNIVNKGRSGAGVQLEISYAQRMALYEGDECGRLGRYIAAVRSGMNG